MKTPPRVSHVSSAPPPRNTSWLSASLMLGPLVLLTRAFHLLTHHRPLAAVTLAVATIVAWVVVELLVRRGLGEDASLEALSLELQGEESRPPARQLVRFIIGSLGIAFSAIVVIYSLVVR